MRSHIVVLFPPGLDDGLSILDVLKPVLVQALVSKLSIEAFDETILNRTPRVDEIQVDLPIISDRSLRDKPPFRS